MRSTIGQRILAWLNRFGHFTVRYERRSGIHQASLALGRSPIRWRAHNRRLFCEALLTCDAQMRWLRGKAAGGVVAVACPRANNIGVERAQVSGVHPL